MSILAESTAFKPFAYPWAYDLWQKHAESHWLHTEVDLSEDIFDWKNKLSKEEKDFVTNILRLFTQSDLQVGQNYHDFLIPRIKNNEVRNMLSDFAAREVIHQAAYALLNETLGLPEEEYHAFLQYTEMSDKMEFMKDNDIKTQEGLALALAQSVFNEGVSLFASFAMLINFQRFGKMKGMCKVVEWSIKDESMHVEGNAKLFNTFCEEHPRIVNDDFKKKIYQMAREVVELEDKFIDLAFSSFAIEGLSKEEVKLYIRYITDRRLIQLGLKGNFNQKENPLDWLDYILNGASHTNFFESRVADYSIANLDGDWGWD